MTSRSSRTARNPAGRGYLDDGTMIIVDNAQSTRDERRGTCDERPGRRPPKDDFFGAEIGYGRKENRGSDEIAMVYRPGEMQSPAFFFSGYRMKTLAIIPAGGWAEDGRRSSETVPAAGRRTVLVSHPAGISTLTASSNEIFRGGSREGNTESVGSFQGTALQGRSDFRGRRGGGRIRLQTPLTHVRRNTGSFSSMTRSGPLSPPR